MAALVAGMLAVVLWRAKAKSPQARRIRGDGGYADGGGVGGADDHSRSHTDSSGSDSGGDGGGGD